MRRDTRNTLLDNRDADGDCAAPGQGLASIFAQVDDGLLKCGGTAVSKDRIVW